jgi:spore germination cell wall hydrolase CwlJ-like protein
LASTAGPDVANYYHVWIRKNDMLLETLTCLALNVYHEARSDDVLGQLAVAQVTLNRVASGRYPDTVCDVVWDHKQFSWTHDGKSDKPKEPRAWKHAQAVAYMALNDMARVPELTPEVLHYHADWVTPYWAKGKQPVARVGSHIFYEGIR